MAYFAKKRGVKTQFDIGQEKEVGQDHTLLVEIGKLHCCTAVLHKASATIEHVRLTSLNEFEAEEQLPELLQPLGEKGFGSVVVCSAFPQALLFPFKLFNNNYAALDVIYDQPEQAYFNDNIAEWQMVNVYSISQAVDNTIRQAFPDVRYFHAYTPCIKIYNGYVADNQLVLHFTGQYFRVLLKKDMAIQLAQTYFYQTPMDVIYYLLKICYEFDLTQQDVYLILSGLVEKDSSLYTDLLQYFTRIHFVQQPEIVLPQSSHPHYFFTSMYNLASCVL